MSSLGYDLFQQAHANAFAAEVINTSAIEGENFNIESVRSSVRYKLWLPNGGLKYQRN